MTYDILGFLLFQRLNYREELHLKDTKFQKTLVYITKYSQYGRQKAGVRISLFGKGMG